MELRCDNGILHGIVEEGVIEVTCKSKRCGKEHGVVVLHKFDLSTGQVIETTRLAEPLSGGK